MASFRLHGLGLIRVAFFGSISSLRFLRSSLRALRLTTRSLSLTTLCGILLENALVHVVATIIDAGAIISRTLTLASSIIPPSHALSLSLALFLRLGTQFVEQWRGGRERCWHTRYALALLCGALHECEVIGLAADRVRLLVARPRGEFDALIGSPFELRLVFRALAVDECVAVVHLVELVQRIERDKVEIGARGNFAGGTVLYNNEYSVLIFRAWWITLSVSMGIFMLLDDF